MKAEKNGLAERIPFYQVDAFSCGPFTGNPAAVCLLKCWPEDALLQQIACENNLSETAFVVREGDNFLLRWFTPALEVELCGHATLAAACVLFTRENYQGESIRFHTRSGVLTVSRDGESYVMDFPASLPARIAPNTDLLVAFGLQANEEAEFWQDSDLIVVLADEQHLDTLVPDFNALAKFKTRGVVVTAVSRKYDFRSRWFGPQVGVNEDPVTGSAHTYLAPLWSEKLNKQSLSAQQGGGRKGEIHCEIKRERRVALSGKALIVIEGAFLL